MPKIVTAQTGNAFSQDPAISLKNLLGSSPTTNPPGQYGGTGSSVSLPAGATVNVDTKWGPSGMHNRILIENMPRLVTYQMLGGQRIRTEDIKRIQVWCDTKSAINNKWLIEEEIRRIILGNIISLQAVGIDQIMFQQEFQDIDIQDMADESNQVGRGGYLARSFCMVKLIYDEVVTLP